MTIKTIKVNLWLLAASYLAFACVSSAHAEQACCGEFSYDTDIEECCNGVVVNKGNCCGGDIKEKVADPCTGAEVCPDDATKLVFDPCIGQMVCPGQETKLVKYTGSENGTITIETTQIQEMQASVGTGGINTAGWADIGDPATTKTAKKPEDASLPTGVKYAQWENTEEHIDFHDVNTVTLATMPPRRKVITKTKMTWKKNYSFYDCPQVPKEKL